MKYIQHYPQHLQDQVKTLIKENKLDSYLLKKYPNKHEYSNDKLLYEYVMDLKNQYLKKYQISKVMYDGKINVINNALGMHTFV